MYNNSKCGMQEFDGSFTPETTVNNSIEPRATEYKVAHEVMYNNSKCGRQESDGYDEGLTLLAPVQPVTTGDDNNNPKHYDPEVLADRRRLQMSIAQLTAQNEALMFENTSMKTENEALRLENASVKAELEKMKDQSRSYCRILGDLFPDGIVKRLTTGRTTHWTSEDIRYSLTILRLSSKCYHYLRSVLNYPLPSESTLRAWAAKIRCEPGRLDNVLQIMHERGKSMKSFEKLVVLSFDEMKVSERVCYDVANDQIVGPYKMVQVIMVRGLGGHWKQPIFYDYDRPVNFDLLSSLIIELYNINFIVVAIVSDLGGSNQGLWRELNIGVGQTSFANPANVNLKIFVFADTPHLLKLMRNHFIDSGFNLNGVFINTQPIYELLRIKTNHELTVAFKLSADHLSVERTERQKVKLAAQLFSNSVATGVEFLGMRSQISSDNWTDVAKFLKLMNDWFDIMNSRVPSVDSRPTKQAYGLALGVQNSILEEVSRVVGSMVVQGKTAGTLLPFQKGILVNNASLRSLYSYVNETYNMTYILTYHLNQDVVESFFSQIRAMGRTYDHPSALEFKYRFRNQIIGRNCKYISRGANVSGDDTENLDLFHGSSKDNESAEHLHSVTTLSAEYLSKIVSSEECAEENDDILDGFVVIGPSNECDKGGLEYLAGYLAHIADAKYGIADLGHRTASISLSSLPPSWVDLLSEGGLKKPTLEFLEKVRNMDCHFVNYHGPHDLRREKGVITNLSQLIAAAVDVPYKLVQKFVKTRTFIRMRLINRGVQSKNITLITQKRMHKTVV